MCQLSKVLQLTIFLIHRYWFPKLFVGVVYSEILNTHLEVTMTKRGQRLIDQSYGLDNYLLEVKKSFRFTFTPPMVKLVKLFIFNYYVFVCRPL